MAEATKSPPRQRTGSINGARTRQSATRFANSRGVAGTALERAEVVLGSFVDIFDLQLERHAAKLAVVAYLRQDVADVAIAKMSVLGAEIGLDQVLEAQTRRDESPFFRRCRRTACETLPPTVRGRRSCREFAGGTLRRPGLSDQDSWKRRPADRTALAAFCRWASSGSRTVSPRARSTDSAIGRPRSAADQNRRSRVSHSCS